MDQIVTDKLGTVSVSNGLVRVQCQTSGADGEMRTSGELVIPANQFGQLINSLQQVGKQLQERLAEAREASGSGEQTDSQQ